jgi:hypothetical protein
MNKRRLIFFAIFGAFHLIAFIFTLVLESSATFLLGLVSYVVLFKYLTFLGLVMVVTDFFWHRYEVKAAQKKEDDARLENNTLKAKVYDMQQAGKSMAEVPPRPSAK